MDGAADISLDAGNLGVGEKALEFLVAAGWCPRQFLSSIDEKNGKIPFFVVVGVVGCCAVVRL